MNATDHFARAVNTTDAGLSSLLYQLASIVLPRGPLPTAPLPHDAPSSAPTLLAPILELVVRHARPSSPFYELEPVVAAAGIFFCRFVIIAGSLTSSPDGHTSVLGHSWTEFALRLGVASVLAFLAYMRLGYDVICAVHLWSHALPTVVGWFVRFMGRRGRGDAKAKKQSAGEDESPPPSLALSMGLSAIFLFGLPLCLLLCRLLSNRAFLQAALQFVPAPASNAFHYMFPIKELAASYDIIAHFATDRELLYDMLAHLLFVTFHIQMGLGHIGIAFLTAEQRRKNMLIRMDVENPAPASSSKEKGKGKGQQNGNKTKQGEAPSAGKFDPSRKFRRSAPTFILLTVLPYMFQIILMGNLNKFAFINVQNRLHRVVRIQELFADDAHLTAIASDSATSMGLYAQSMDTVVSTSYDVFNRKLFSLPKLMLLPAIISRQPMLLMKIFPFIFLTDVLKGRLVASVTDKVEEIENEARDVKSIRQKVEQFDMKNAELLRRSGLGATKFTERRWDELTLEYQAKMAAGDLLKRTRGFFLWLQRNFVFVVLIDIALAKLLAEGSIVVSEIFVFSRAIEDVVDLLLIRSRSESELAKLMTQVDKLKVLDDVWSKSKEARVLPCLLETADEGAGSITLNNLEYSRGTASVSIERLVIEPGIYAVTGANGSGKSTLFRLLMACGTNERPIDLHESIELGTPLHHWDISDNIVLPEDSCKVADEGCEVIDSADGAEEIPVTSITVPSSDVVEISQTFYWPLYSKPIDWIQQQHIASDLSERERNDCIKKVAEELQSLSFAQSQKAANGSDEDEAAPEEDMIEKLMAELQEEKEDWFSELSGGQKSKVELVRKVFLRDHCPSVLLIDETMAPLDPASKSQVMSKLKAFCQQSIVLVIYHTDVGAGVDADAPAKEAECVPSNSFFDRNLHVEKKYLITRPVC
ncbi:hypothetical protein ACHAXT_000103 [Thalassiosira profunda]